MPLPAIGTWWSSTRFERIPSAISPASPGTSLSPTCPAARPPPVGQSRKVFALRQRAALFGNNAPDPNLFVSAQIPSTGPTTSLPNLVDTTVAPWQWANFQITSSNQVDLDSTYPKVVAGSWFALTEKKSRSKTIRFRAREIPGCACFRIAFLQIHGTTLQRPTLQRRFARRIRLEREGNGACRGLR